MTAIGEHPTPTKAYRAIVVIRPLRHHNVHEFATVHATGFTHFGLARVWNPLKEMQGPNQANLT